MEPSLGFLCILDFPRSKVAIYFLHVALSSMIYELLQLDHRVHQPTVKMTFTKYTLRVLPQHCDYCSFELIPVFDSQNPASACIAGYLSNVWFLLLQMIDHIRHICMMQSITHTTRHIRTLPWCMGCELFATQRLEWDTRVGIDQFQYARVMRQKTSCLSSSSLRIFHFFLFSFLSFRAVHLFCLLLLPLACLFIQCLSCLCWVLGCWAFLVL